MEKVNSDERRAYSRAAIDVEIEVCHLLEKGPVADFPTLFCRGRDVGGGGVSFYGQNRYQNENVLRLGIPLSNKYKSQQADGVKILKVMGTVMWCKKNLERNCYVTGVQFLNIYEQDLNLLIEFVESV